MMRSAYLTFLALGLVSLQASCDTDVPDATAESVSMTLRFTGDVGRERLALESKTYRAAQAVEGYRVSRISYYLSEVKLLEVADGQQLETDVSDVAYVRLAADGTASLEFDNVPAGAYTGIKFNVGLTPEQDMTVPADYAPTHPLGRATEYWNDWGSYIFMKVEGRADTLADGAERFDAAFVYHVGRSQEFAETVELPYLLSLAPGAANEVSLAIDIATLLGLDGPSPLSVVSRADHTNGFAERLMDNVGPAISPAR